MGVDRIDYLIYGYKLPGEMVDEILRNDKFLPYIEGHESVDFTIIFDGMIRKYVVFGQILGSAEEYEGWDFKTIDIKNLNPEKVKEKYKKLFNVDSEYTAEPYLFIFSHFW